jgi:hypothetical protein
MKVHAVIPDVQAKPGNNFKFLERVGHYLADKKPDVIVQIGDFADMESLSSYDKGKKSFEGRSYTRDIEAANEAMDALVGPMLDEMLRLKKNKEKQWRPRFILTLGNHEERINRAIEEDRKLDGLISVSDLPYAGWEVHPFLEPVEIDGVFYCHYFPTGVLGRPAVTASAMVSKLHASCVAGHQQGKQVAYGKRPDGSMITCIMAGSCYEHTESYLDYQSNKHWRGIIMLHEVNKGTFDEMFVSLGYLEKKYE